MARERPWQRIAGDLRAQITDGRLRLGDQLPTSAELMDRYSVARQTVHNAITSLRTEGIVETKLGKGWFVTRPGSAPVVLELDGLNCGLEIKVATSQESGNVELRLANGNREVVIIHGTEVDSHTTMSAYGLLKAVTGFVQQLHLHDQPGARIVDPSFEE